MQRDAGEPASVDGALFDITVALENVFMVADVVRSFGMQERTARTLGARTRGMGTRRRWCHAHLWDSEVRRRSRARRRDDRAD